jgi:putative transposase
VPRPLRIEYPGAIYHVMNRGDRREAIFADDGDRKSFLQTLAQSCERTGWEAHAWCLMGNHFHLVVETPRGNLVVGMKWLLGTYTQRFNRRHRLSGHLFQGRYKAQVIDAESPGYLRTACDYVHLNPARAGLVGPEEALESWRWSSYPEYLQRGQVRPGWLRTDRLLGEHGVAPDHRRDRREFAARMEVQRGSDNASALMPLRSGWRLGAEDFLERLLSRTSVQAKRGHGRATYEENEEAVALRIMREELDKAGVSAAELPHRRKGDSFKVRVARRVRCETALTLSRIAELLHMGTPTHVAHLLYHRRDDA